MLFVWGHSIIIMIIATHGIIASQLAGFDADAQAFFDRVTTAGGSLSATEKTAVNTLVLDLKGYSIWTKMKAIYPMVGASSAACAQNLKSSSFTGTFSSGWTYASTGVTPNGTSAYMNSGFSMTNNFTSTGNASMGCYLRTDTGINGADMGAGGTLNGSDGILIYSSFNGSIYYADALGSSIINSGQSNTDSRGFYVVARNSGVHSQHKRGNITINDSETEAISTNLQNLNIYIGGGNPASGNTVNLYSDRENAFSFIGDFINQSEINDFYTAVQAFQTTLARQV